MSEAEQHQPAAEPTATDERPKYPTLSEVRGTLKKIVDGCKMTDGTMGDFSAFSVTRTEMRNIFAADRYLDELGILREAAADRAVKYRR